MTVIKDRVTMKRAKDLEPGDRFNIRETVELMLEEGHLKVEGQDYAALMVASVENQVTKTTASLEGNGKPMTVIHLENGLHVLAHDMWSIKVTEQG